MINKTKGYIVLELGSVCMEWKIKTFREYYGKRRFELFFRIERTLLCDEIQYLRSCLEVMFGKLPGTNK